MKEDRDVGPVIQYITEREDYYKDKYSKIIRNEVEEKFSEFGTQVYDDITRKVENDEIDLECPECAEAAAKFIESSNQLLQLAEDFADESYTDVAEDIVSQYSIGISEQIIYNSYKNAHPEYNKKKLDKEILRKIANKILCIRILSNSAYEDLFDEELISKIKMK